MQTGIVSTIGEKCKRCYSCVRNCPAKAIRVRKGQAEVIPERCTACGTCLKVCAQKAKRVQDDKAQVFQLLEHGGELVACLAPSFPSFFTGVKHGQIVSALRQLGFTKVVEVAFGAELVSGEYARLLSSSSRKPLITTACPAVINLVERFFPSLLGMLAPVVSPMIATGRFVKREYGEAAKCVFIGPCVAKKGEIRDPKVGNAVIAVLTFTELADMFVEKEVVPKQLRESSFDGPRPHFGRLFPVAGGLLKTAGKEVRILDPDILVAAGRQKIVELLKLIEAGKAKANFFDVLLCDGCADGPCGSPESSLLTKRQAIVDYFMSRITEEGANLPDIRRYRGLDMRRQFTDRRVGLPVPSEAEIKAVLHKIERNRPEDELNCGACGYSTCRDKAIAVCQGLAEAEMCLPHLIEGLERLNRWLHESQKHFVQTEKLASMGQLAASIAHEVNNPLTGVLLHSHLLMEDVPEGSQSREYVEKIVHEAGRCKDIIRGLLDFSRQSDFKMDWVNIVPVIEKTLALVEGQAVFHNVRVVRQFGESVPAVYGDERHLLQAFMNIVLNAAEAMKGSGVLTIGTEVAPCGHSLTISFSDTGCGIPPELSARIFEPFFTTKDVGKGTGLGLAITQATVQRHGGTIRFESKAGKGATFFISLPTGKGT